MATLAAIREKTAKKLGLFGTAQTLRSTIDDDLTDAYTEVYAELESLDLATWASTDAVPDQFVSAIVTWMAYTRVDEYAVPDNKYQRIVSDAGPQAVNAEAKIRRLQGQALQGETEIEYF